MQSDLFHPIEFPQPSGRFFKRLRFYLAIFAIRGLYGLKE